MNYSEELEKQNDELKKMLAHEQTSVLDKQRQIDFWKLNSDRTWIMELALHIKLASGEISLLIYKINIYPHEEYNFKSDFPEIAFEPNVRLHLITLTNPRWYRQFLIGKDDDRDYWDVLSESNCGYYREEYPHQWKTFDDMVEAVGNYLRTKKFYIRPYE